jgi:hypothetical protein
LEKPEKKEQKKAKANSAAKKEREQSDKDSGTDHDLGFIPVSPFYDDEERKRK